jgi:hypothetical protein
MTNQADAVTLFKAEGNISEQRAKGTFVTDRL